MKMTIEELKEIEIKHNGFHGLNTVRIRVPADAKWGDEVEVTRRVAQRINNEVCGVSQCTCGEHIAKQIDHNRYTVTVPEPDTITQGAYPQNN